MEFKKNNQQNFANQNAKINKKEDEKDGILSVIKKVFDSQVFFNSRLKALEYIEKQGKVTTAMLTMNITKVKSFLGANYNVKFSLLYSTGDGQVYQNKNFYTVELPGKEGMIPDYILKELEVEESFDVKFNAEDLSTLYNERDAKIDEESTFDEIIQLCKKENVVSIKLIDRVFYTKIECYSSEGINIGDMSIGVINRIPAHLASRLYPGGEVEHSI